MRCPFCNHIEDKVIDSRQSRDGEVIRRRRECLKCEGRFTSYERIEKFIHSVMLLINVTQNEKRHIKTVNFSQVL